MPDASHLPLRQKHLFSGYKVPVKNETNKINFTYVYS